MVLIVRPVKKAPGRWAQTSHDLPGVYQVTAAVYGMMGLVIVPVNHQIESPGLGYPESRFRVVNSGALHSIHLLLEVGTV